MDKKYNSLTPEEERIISRKGTEAPFSGQYDNFSEKGVYVCKKCGAELYYSDNKFDSGCGWPSFDAEIPGTIKRISDPDGTRTEIICNNCGAHLGHIFTGEKLTPKNIRHCVNSISLNFKKMSNSIRKAYFAGGCFWGMESCFQNLEGVISTRVGYMGGHKDSPTYEDVSAGNTGHAETLEVTFDNSKITYENLAKLFFEIHDPAQEGGQGPDIGEQYRSAIFYISKEQKEIAEKLIKILEQKGLDAITEVAKAGIFWEAENYHQKYYAKKGQYPYCHTRVRRF